MIKKYKAKTLFNGSTIGKVGLYVAIPEKGFKNCKIEVEYQGRIMTVEYWLKAEAFRRFPDKWGRGTYTLGYFKFVPDETGEKQEEIKVIENGSLF